MDDNSAIFRAWAEMLWQDRVQAIVEDPSLAHALVARVADLEEQVRMRDENALDGAAVAHVIDERDVARERVAELEQQLAERPGGREGIVTAYDYDGEYVGCVGSGTWAWLLNHPDVDATWLASAEAAEARCRELEAEAELACHWFDALLTVIKNHDKPLAMGIVAQASGGEIRLAKLRAALAAHGQQEPA